MSITCIVWQLMVKINSVIKKNDKMKDLPFQKSERKGKEGDVRM